MSEQENDALFQAERALLGTLISHEVALDTLEFNLQPKDFLSASNQRLLEVIIQMREADVHMDPVSLLVFMEGLPSIPLTLTSYAMSLVQESGAIANLNYYAKVVKERAVMRELIGEAARVPLIAEDRSLTTQDKMSQIGQSIMAVLDNASSASTDPVNISHLIAPHIEKMELRLNGDPSIISTGYPDVDDVLAGGFRTQQFVLIGGRPSMGKTTLAMNFATKIAVHNRIPVGILSMEMSGIQLMDKLAADLGSINYTNIRTGKLTDDEYERYSIALSRLQDCPLIIDEECGLDMTAIERKVRMMVRKHRIRLLVVDYLQMIKGDKSIRDRAQQMEDISGRFKALGKKLDICVMGLSQLTRGADKEARPSIAQLRNSGALEQDADVIIFPYREERDNPDTDKKGMAEIIFAKQREGECRDVPMLFDGQYSRFREYIPMH